MNIKCTAAIMHENAYTDDIYYNIIKACGFNDQNKILMSNGYTNLKTNLKLLKMCGGDLKHILVKLGLNNNETDMDGQTKINQIENTKEEDMKVEKIIEEKCVRPSKEIKLITKKKVDHQKLKDQEIENDRYLLDIVESGWTDQNSSLIDAGFTCYKKNYIALKEFNGNGVKALDYLLDIQRKIEEELKRQKIEKQIKDQAKLRMLDELNKLGYNEANKQLVQAGYTKIARNYQFLKAFKGDANKIIRSLDCDKKLKALEEKLGIKIRGQKHEKIPDGVNALVIDASSIAYVDNKLKNLVASNRRPETDVIVCEIIKKIISSGQGYHCIVFFDQTVLSYEAIIVSLKGKMYSLIVKSVKPTHQSIIETVDIWMTKNPNAIKKTQFITLNKELAVHLLEKGIPFTQLMNSLDFLTIGKQIIGSEVYDKFIQDLLPNSSQSLQFHI